MGRPDEPMPEQPTAGRLMSLDAYRGFIMLMMVSGGLGMEQLRTTAQWHWLADQFEHREWQGCTFWDLIQPSFMFMVGVAMALSFARRAAGGESWGRQFGHIAGRCLALIAIGIVLDSVAQPAPERGSPVIQFIRVLQQIALGYFLAFFVIHRPPWFQFLAAVLLLAGHSAAFLLYDSGGDAWRRDANFGWALDRMIHSFFEGLGFPKVWPLSKGGYVVFNAVSSTATILFGVLAGELIRGRLSRGAKVLVLVGAGAAGLLLGSLPEQWVPMVKKIWTASFAVYAGGWTCLLMAAFYTVIDVGGLRRWSFPLVVVGVNSIFIYTAAGLLTGTIRNLLQPFTAWPLNWAAQRYPAFGPWQPVVVACLVVVVLWSLCYWLYRHRIFFKV